jgi:hypothetical protein
VPFFIGEYGEALEEDKRKGSYHQNVVKPLIRDECRYDEVNKDENQEQFIPVSVIEKFDSGHLWV